jgi:hypothetical protein
MRNCFCDGVYGSGVWTSGIQGDFDYRNNVVTNGNYVWTNQSGVSAAADAAGRGGRQAAPASAKPSEAIRYKVVDSYFAGNRRLAGSGTAARLEYQDIEPSNAIRPSATTCTRWLARKQPRPARDYS